MDKSYHPNNKYAESPKTNTILGGPMEPPIDWHKRECLQMALQACGPGTDSGIVVAMAQKFYEFIKTQKD